MASCLRAGGFTLGFVKTIFCLFPEGKKRFFERMKTVVFGSKQAGLLLSTLGALVGYFSILIDAALKSRKVFFQPNFRVFQRQIFFTGVQSLPFLAAASLVAGFVALSQLFLVLNRDMAKTLEVFQVLLVQEGAVLIVVFFLLARSGSAMASELASCSQRGEVVALYRLGIDPGEYLVVPRIASMMCCVAALTVYCQVVLVFGGFALMSFFYQWDYLFSLEKFSRQLVFGDAVLTVCKTLFFGATVGAVCSWQGLKAVSGPQGIPVATSRAIIHGFALILLEDALFATLMDR